MKKIFPLVFFGLVLLAVIFIFTRDNKPSVWEGVAATVSALQSFEDKFFPGCPHPRKLFPDFTLVDVNKTKGLDNGFIPPDLEEMSDRIRTLGNICLRRESLRELGRMFEDASKEGLEFAVSSGFRDPKKQALLYRLWTNLYGASALDMIAPAGHSEHQLGTTVDLTGRSIGFKAIAPEFAHAIEGRWLTKNAYKYGYILSYPKGKEKATGYSFEPWHFRYVGVRVAGLMHDKKIITFAEYAGERERPFPKTDFVGIISKSRSQAVGWIDSGGEAKIILSSDADAIYPMASITKLMTALVAKSLFSKDRIITISERAASAPEDFGQLRAGDSFRAEDLIKILLIESSNDAAVAFEEKLPEGRFLEEMNSKAREIGFSRTSFVNVHGLDGANGKYNYSTAKELVGFFAYLMRNHPDLVRVTTETNVPVRDTAGQIHHIMESTDKLLEDTSFSLSIVGGKTGETPLARKNLILGTKVGRGYLVGVVLGSEDSFSDMRELLEKIKNNFEW